jgi:hypothetical protein
VVVSRVWGTNRVELGPLFLCALALTWLSPRLFVFWANSLDAIAIFNNPGLAIANLVIPYMPLSCNFYPIDAIVDFSQSVWG